MEKYRRDVEPFSSFGNPLSEGNRNRDFGECADSYVKRKRILSEQRALHEFLERNAAQARSSEAQSELDRKEWIMQNADIAPFETDMQLESERMELY